MKRLKRANHTRLSTPYELVRAPTAAGPKPDFFGRRNRRRDDKFVRVRKNGSEGWRRRRRRVRESTTNPKADICHCSPGNLYCSRSRPRPLPNRAAGPLQVPFWRRRDTKCARRRYSERVYIYTHYILYISEYSSERERERERERKTRRVLSCAEE